jgi:pimeloyl-ACP methyl ester carboxylesterase
MTAPTPGPDELGGVSRVGAVAPDVQSVIMPATGHFLAEESPEELLATLTEFVAPYRPGTATATLATA